MVLGTDIRKSARDATPVLALVGATDLAVERVRAVLADPSQVQAGIESRVNRAQAEVEKVVTGFDRRQFAGKVAKVLDAKAVQAAAQQVPALAVARALEVAGRAGTGYEELAERGKVVMDRVRSQKATQDLLTQGKVTVTRTKAAVTTARKAVDETASGARAAVKVRRRSDSRPVEKVGPVAEPAVAVTKRARVVRSGSASIRTSTMSAASTRKTRPDAAEPTVTEPTVTEPTVTKAAVTKATLTRKTKPVATKPAATKPAATKPAATKPAATKPAATKPSATKPAATKPAAAEPTTAGTDA